MNIELPEIRERLDRQEQAIRILAEAIQDGEYHEMARFIDRILHPNKPEISID